MENRTSCATANEGENHSILDDIACFGANFDSPEALKALVLADNLLAQWSQSNLAPLVLQLSKLRGHWNSKLDCILFRYFGETIASIIPVEISLQISGPGQTFTTTVNLESLSGSTVLSVHSPHGKPHSQESFVAEISAVNIAKSGPNLCTRFDFSKALRATPDRVCAFAPIGPRTLFALTPSATSQKNLLNLVQLFHPMADLAEGMVQSPTHKDYKAPIIMECLLNCGHSMERTLLLQLSFFMQAAPNKKTMAIHPLLEMAFPNLRARAIELASQFNNYKSREDVAAARDFLMKNGSGLTYATKEILDSDFNISKFITRSIASESVLCVPFPEGVEPASKSDPNDLILHQQYRTWKFNCILRNTHGVWQYLKPGMGSWQSAQGATFRDPESGQSFVFRSFKDFFEKTRGFEFDSFDSFLKFCDDETENMDWLEWELLHMHENTI